MFGQQKGFKWLFVLVVFCFCIYGQSIAEEEPFAYEEGMHLIAVPRDTFAADSVMAITEAYITCDHSFLKVGEETVWTLNLSGASSDAYTFEYNLWYRAPNNAPDTYRLYSGIAGTSSLFCKGIPEYEGIYFLQVLIRDRYDGILEAISSFYTTASDTLMQKVEDVVTACKNSGAETPVEIALFMHDYLIDYADYDETYTNYDPDGVLLQGSGTCQSYATAYKLLMDQVGIDCLFVVGASRDQDHAWNMVKIDGVWYQVDCTWDDPVGGSKQHSFFLITDEVMAKDHVWDRSAYPACEDARYLATEVTYGGFTFDGGFGDITIKSYQGTDKEVVVPAIINGRKVKKIAQECFLSNPFIETLVISEGIEQLSPDFVAICLNLKTITIPSTARLVIVGNSFTNIVLDSFVEMCPMLEQVIVADDNPYLCVVDGILYNKSMTELICCPPQYKNAVFQVPDSINKIRGSAFANNEYLKEIVIPDSIQSLENWAFSNCFSLEKINIPRNCRKIGQFVFQGTQVKSLHIPAATIEIEPAAFSSVMQTITVDESNPKFYAVDNVLFDYSGVLHLYSPQKDDSEYTVPSNVQHIRDEAFGGARNLKAIHLPEGLIGIHTSAFLGCTGITEVVLPKTLDFIGDCAFMNCMSLERLVFSSSETEFRDGAPYLLGNVVGTVIWGETESTAQKWAEAHNYLFQDITKPFGTSDSGTCGENLLWTISEDGVLTISGTGYMEFYNPPKWEKYVGVIKRVVVEEGVASIADFAFMNCKYLSSVDLPTSLERIGHRAFMSCVSLSEITIPDSVINVESYAFDSCTSLKTVDLPDLMRELQQYTFVGCSSLSEVILPRNLTYIFEGAFKDCISLKEITIPEEVKYLPARVFEGCTSLQQVKITALEAVCERVFAGCTSLQHIVLSADTYIFFENAFTDSSLEKIVIPTQQQMRIYGNPFQEVHAAIYCCYGTSFHDWAIANGIIVFPIELYDFSIPDEFVMRNSAQVDIGLSASASQEAYLTWHSSNENVAIVRDGKLIAVGAGTSVVTVSCNGNIIDQMSLTVTDSADEHIWGEGKITNPPGCQQIGVKRFVCSACGVSNDELIPPLGHMWEVQSATEANCSTAGCTISLCTRCNQEKTEWLYAWDEHTWNDHGVIEAPNCTDAGINLWVCMLCGKSREEILPKFGHTFGRGEITQMQTCTSSGERICICTVCGISQTMEVPPHFWASGVLDVWLTDNTGEITYTCQQCGATKKKHISLGLAGDVNEDELVDMFDIIDMMEWYCGGIVELNLANGEVTGEGNIDMLDIIALMEWYCGAEITLCGYAEEVAE